MKNEFRKLIESKGYWRIHFQPLSKYERRFSSLEDLKSIMRSCTVEKRGWPYPYVPLNNSDGEGMENAGTYIQGWIDWERSKEFWRFYQSGQFINYRALSEDWMGVLKHENTWDRDPRALNPGEWISMKGLNWQICEVFEFLSRLGEHDVFKDGVKISISLKNTSNRGLEVDRNQVPFSTPRIVSSEEIDYEAIIAPTNLNLSKENSLNCIKYIYDKFGWNPPDDQIRAHQEEFYQLNIR